MTSLTIIGLDLDTRKNTETIIARIIRALKGRARRHITPGGLSRLDDHMLRDMGLARR